MLLCFMATNPTATLHISNLLCFMWTEDGKTFTQCLQFQHKNCSCVFVYFVCLGYFFRFL